MKERLGGALWGLALLAFLCWALWWVVTGPDSGRDHYMCLRGGGCGWYSDTAFKVMLAPILLFFIGAGAIGLYRTIVDSLSDIKAALAKVDYALAAGIAVTVLMIGGWLWSDHATKSGIFMPHHGMYAVGCDQAEPYTAYVPSHDFQTWDAFSEKTKNCIVIYDGNYQETP